jgi:hypothetical protein
MNASPLTTPLATPLTTHCIKKHKWGPSAVLYTEQVSMDTTQDFSDQASGKMAQDFPDITDSDTATVDIL